MSIEYTLRYNLLLSTNKIEIQEIGNWVNNLVFSRLEKEDIDKIDGPTGLQAFKLMQMSIEYLSHTQNYLEDILSDYEMEYDWITKATEQTYRKWDINKKHMAANKDTIHKKKFILKDYELMFKDIGYLDYDLSAIKYEWDICNIKRDGKKSVVFKSLYDLENHYKQ